MENTNRKLLAATCRASGVVTIILFLSLFGYLVWLPPVVEQVDTRFTSQVIVWLTIGIIGMANVCSLCGQLVKPLAKSDEL